MALLQTAWAQEMGSAFSYFFVIRVIQYLRRFVWHIVVITCGSGGRQHTHGTPECPKRMPQRIQWAHTSSSKTDGIIPNRNPNDLTCSITLVPALGGWVLPWSDSGKPSRSWWFASVKLAQSCCKFAGSDLRCLGYVFYCLWIGKNTEVCEAWSQARLVMASQSAPKPSYITKDGVRWAHPKCDARNVINDVVYYAMHDAMLRECYNLGRARATPHIQLHTTSVRWNCCKYTTLVGPNRKMLLVFANLGPICSQKWSERNMICWEAAQHDLRSRQDRMW